MSADAAGKPTVFCMVKQAVRELGATATVATIREWVQKKFPGTNRSTIQCQTLMGCVNVASRVNWHPNKQPRLANNPQYDCFFRDGDGRIEVFDPARHGQWEIFQHEPGAKLSVRLVQQDLTDASNGATAGLPSAEGTLDEADQPLTGERAWVATIQPLLEAALAPLAFQGTKVRVDMGYRLPYAYEVMRYKEDAPERDRIARYETDLLIYDDVPGEGLWVPRVVIECKIKGVTTHDALTYSGKAATHKHVHPYLRYGMLIGSYGKVLPARLVRHGAFFDFMAVWSAAEPDGGEWEDLIDVLIHEVRASRSLQELLADRSLGKKAFRLLHRPLVFKGAQ